MIALPVYATIADIHVYNLQFSINAPGEAVVQTTIVTGSETEVMIRHLDLIAGSGPEGRGLINNGTLHLDDVTIYESIAGPMSGNIILNPGILTAHNNCSILFLED